MTSTEIRSSHIAVRGHLAPFEQVIDLTGGKMTDNITVSRGQATEIFKALNGIGELLKKFPSKPENAAVMYANVRHHVEHCGDSNEPRWDAASEFELTHYRPNASLEQPRRDRLEHSEQLHGARLRVGLGTALQDESVISTGIAAQGTPDGGTATRHHAAAKCPAARSHEIGFRVMRLRRQSG